MQYVTSYKLATSLDEITWNYARREGGSEIFPGNSNQNGKRSHDLQSSVTARFVKLEVLEWQTNLAMRWDVY